MYLIKIIFNKLNICVKIVYILRAFKFKYIENVLAQKENDKREI